MLYKETFFSPGPGCTSHGTQAIAGGRLVGVSSAAQVLTTYIQSPSRRAAAPALPLSMINNYSIVTLGKFILPQISMAKWRLDSIVVVY